MNVYLTGGTGLLGSYVAELAVTEGIDLVALTRTTSDTTHLESLGANVYAGDVTDVDSLVAGMRGCDAVVHAASPNGGQMSPDPYEQVTLGGTEQVVAAMQFSGVKRLVYISSIAVHGLDPVRGGPVREEGGFGRELLPHDHYARAKIDAERRIRRAHAEGSVHATVLRPGWMFGGLVENSYSRLADALAARRLFKIGAGDNRVPLVYAGNVAHAICLALTQPSCDYRVYICAGEGTLTQDDLFASLERATGSAPPPIAVPKPLMLAAARLQEEASALLGYRLPILFSQYLVHMLGSDWQFDQRRIREDLGYEPPVPPEEAFARAEAWYRNSKKGVTCTQ